MARDLALKTNVEPVDSDYPFGRIKDDDGSGNGTPVDEPVYGDFHQFFAKMFSESGLTYNNLPDNDYSGFQFFEALQENINMCKGFSVYLSSQLIPITDFGKLIFYNSLSSGTFTLPTSNAYAVNKKIKIINIGGASANLTITVDSGVITPVGFPTTIILGRFDVVEFVCIGVGVWYLEKIHRKALETVFTISKITVGSGGSAPAFVSPWTSGGGLPDVKFFIDDKGFVHLTGAASISVALSGNETIFTLPTGYRPTEDMSIPVTVIDDSTLAIGSLIIQSDGTVFINPGNLTAAASLTVYFDAINYYTDF